MKPYDAETGSVWWFHHRDILDIFVVLDGYEMDDQRGYECRRMLVLHSDDEASTEIGLYSISEGSPYNDSSTRFA